MDETDWFMRTDPRVMLAFLGNRLSARKLWLFAAACCGRVQDLLADADREALAVIERFADRRADSTELSTAVERTTNPALRSTTIRQPDPAATEAVTACSTLRAAASGDPTHPIGLGEYEAARLGEMVAQCRLLRDIAGNPFRPVAADPAWHTSTVQSLARVVYDERAFDRMPILADALEEAGCADADVLAHCRGGLPHVRGCWVLDLILGKR